LSYEKWSLEIVNGAEERVEVEKTNKSTYPREEIMAF
jgi:hypothetical protein